MKYLVAFLIVCLVALGTPAVSSAQVVTGDNSGESDSSGGSEATNLSYVLLAAVIIVAIGASTYAAYAYNSKARESDSPVTLVACTESSDDLVYEPGDIFSAGLAYRADF